LAVDCQLGETDLVILPAPAPEARSTSCLPGKFLGQPAYAPSVVEGRLGTSCSSAPETHLSSQGRTASCDKGASIITKYVPKY